MKKHTDYLFGFLASGFTFVTDHFNSGVGTVIGLVSLVVMLLRLRREWKHRDDPPND